MTPPAKVVIVGGGTAGWMSACLLAKHWPASDITLIESADIGTVGVGEGSTPFLKQFFKTLGISESTWMPACDATYKVGISFSNWCGDTEFPAYFHPFFTPLDIDNGYKFFDAVTKRRHGDPVVATPEDFFVAGELVRRRRDPVPHQCPGDIDYAYHFDAAKLGRVLRDVATQLGVTHITDTIDNVVAEHGQIISVHGQVSGTRQGDLFIDCSGFRGLLVKQTLKRSHHSYRHTLFNNAAVALPTQPGTLPQPQTVSHALQHGWMWQIPLTSRQGNGYVYASDFCSRDQAERELREALGSDADNAPARHLNMEVGRLHHHWQGNCLAIGLSQGFIEPLEATALMLVQYALQHAVECWRGHDSVARVHDIYNREMNRMFDGIRDYIAAHYYLNTRHDSAYWRACRDMQVPDTLAFLVNAWDNGGNFDGALNEVREQLVYLKPSWYCLFAGMGRLPRITDKPQRAVAEVSSLVNRYFPTA